MMKIEELGDSDHRSGAVKTRTRTRKAVDAFRAPLHTTSAGLSSHFSPPSSSERSPTGGVSASKSATTAVYAGHTENLCTCPHV